MAFAVSGEERGDGIELDAPAPMFFDPLFRDVTARADLAPTSWPMAWDEVLGIRRTWAITAGHSLVTSQASGLHTKYPARRSVSHLRPAYELARKGEMRLRTMVGSES